MTTQSNAPSLSEALREALAFQQEAEMKDFRQRMGQSLRERVQQGNTIVNVSLEFRFFPAPPNSYCRELYSEKYIQAALVRCPGNVSKFRAGSKVMLSNGPSLFPMVISEDRVDEMVLVPGDYDYKECHINPRSYPRDGWQIDEGSPGINSRLLSTADSRMQSDPDLARRMEMFLGGTLPEGGTPVEVPSSRNPSQDEALSRSLGCDSFHLIQGPPGTGKTYTIALIVSRLLDEGKKVLVTGPTHTAINNCLMAIERMLPSPGGKIVKVGDRYQDAEIPPGSVIERKAKFPYGSYTISRNLSRGGIVVGATPYAVCYPVSKKMDGWEFDAAVIDEASQVSIPLALPVLTLCRKAILVGDHMQLDPIMPRGSGNFLFRSSIFKHLVDLYPDNCTMLDLSYRLPPSLVRIPTAISYGGRLRSALGQDDLTFTSFREVADYSYLVTSPTSEVLFLHHEFDAMGRSPFEAKVTAQIVRTLLPNGVPLSRMALIAPYRAQVREIKRQLLAGGVVGEADLEDVFVDTVERMQGQERDYVVLSLANSNPADTSRHLDFIYSPNRLNVAITRARVKCWVLSNAKLFDLCSELDGGDERVGEGLAAFRRFREMATVLEDRYAAAPSEEEEW